MGEKYQEIPKNLQDFIAAQKLFFVATASAKSYINLSPKGSDSLRVLSKNRVIWLNLTGSGNETAAHAEDGRMTIMFCAFAGSPMILRLYGKATAVHKNDKQWAQLYSLFPANIGARQIFDLQVDLVQTSCGMAVPFFDYQSERHQLDDWASKKGGDGIAKYWQDKNAISLNGKPSKIKDKNL
ncbi:MAG: pyridoxamine 5'-phosphate oxidase family protein [Candidatus Thioglobus sp.]|nr:MAG: pyridoxamine 5'-phosphate oxidase family protein [Candidatus Thioglobus sp.]KAA0451573.1 MAG: pyridoxamine 5'-phosphate oxidase family protein [Candidatus Thioglobus sp.]